MSLPQCQFCDVTMFSNSPPTPHTCAECKAKLDKWVQHPEDMAEVLLTVAHQVKRFLRRSASEK